MPKISYQARTFVQSRLTDGNTGFNHWIMMAAADYSLNPFTLSLVGGATAIATISSGAIASIAVTTPGAGYLSATAFIVGDGTGATASVTVTGGAVSSISVTAGGQNYSAAYVVLLAKAALKGRNLYLNNVKPDDIETSGVDATWPLACVYTERANNAPPIVTPSVFSGECMTVVDFWLGGVNYGFLKESVPEDSESLGDMIEDAMVETFNRQDYYALPAQFAPGLTYNNELTRQDGPLTFGGENWRQLVRFNIKHRFLTSGR